jgi:hypothetical protein
MVAVRLSQQEQQPHHCYGTGEIDDGRHICGLLARAWYRGHCQNAAENVITQQRPAATGAVRNLYRTCGFCLPRDASSGQPAPDGRRTCLLWLIEAHAHASKAGRMRIGPATQNAQIWTAHLVQEFRPGTVHIGGSRVADLEGNDPA